MKKKMVVGITGGMGAGKTVVARILEKKGFSVFSADQIAKELTATGEPLLKTIQEQFGSSSINADGSLNRAWLRSTISADPEARQKLDKIMHPAIQKRSQELIQNALNSGSQFVFYEAPLLFEAQSHRNLDAVVCVWAEDDLRAQRVQARDNRPLQEIRKLIQSQMSQEEKKSRSQFLIENNGDLSFLEKQVSDLVNTLKPKE
jgi:dephospho-CoA kinase